MRFFSRSQVNISLSLLVVFSVSLALFVSASSKAQATHASNAHLAQTSSQTDWPIFGYDLQHTHYNPNETVLNPTTISGLTLDWKATTPGAIERNSSPIIANGIVYIGAHGSLGFTKPDDKPIHIEEINVISSMEIRSPGRFSFEMSEPGVGGQGYSIQVGGSVANVSIWEDSDGPLSPSNPLHRGLYSVLGKPTVTVDFINQVLASYHSPAAGKGRALYHYGVKYGIDPAFALAFFLHESTMGTTGVARKTLSLGDLRCIRHRPCVDRHLGGYAQMYSWEDGFKQWYKLIRNLYVAKWGLMTVDQIIPVYAPSGDHNDVHGYTTALKHYIKTWHSGIIRPW